MGYDPPAQIDDEINRAEKEQKSFEDQKSKEKLFWMRTTRKKVCIPHQIEQSSFVKV